MSAPEPQLIPDLGERGLSLLNEILRNLYQQGVLRYDVTTSDGGRLILGNIDNANIKAAAGIVYSKLTLTGGIVDADISATAAIASKKLDSVIRTGWLDANEAWTYASATTITVPTDATTKYSVGDKIRLKQGGAYKYFYVVAVAATLLTVTGGTDYTVANAAITDNYYSKGSSPLGFPQWFNYTPTWTNLTVGNGTLVVSRFSMVGKFVSLYLKFQLGSTSSIAGAVSFSSPTNISSSFTDTLAAHIRGTTQFQDDSAGVSFSGGWDSVASNAIRVWALVVSGTHLTFQQLSSTVPWTWATSDLIIATVWYEAS